MTVAIAVIKVSANFLATTKRLFGIVFLNFTVNVIFLNGLISTVVFIHSTKKYEVPESSLKATRFGTQTIQSVPDAADTFRDIAIVFSFVVWYWICMNFAYKMSYICMLSASTYYFSAN